MKILNFKTKEQRDRNKRLKEVLSLMKKGQSIESAAEIVLSREKKNDPIPDKMS